MRDVLLKSSSGAKGCCWRPAASAPCSSSAARPRLLPLQHRQQGRRCGFVSPRLMVVVAAALPSDEVQQQQQQQQVQQQPQPQQPPKCTRVPLPPPPERRAEMEAARAAALARLAAADPNLARSGETALMAAYQQERQRGAVAAAGGAPPHDGAPTRGYRAPAFLRDFPVPAGYSFNFNSFMGTADPHGGKYYVPPALVPTFLRRSADALRYRGAKLCLSENYNKRAYRHFQELDFDWGLPVGAVLALVPRVARIVAEEAARAHGLSGAAPAPVVSMRTPYKVHLNFPGIVTSEGRARRARRAAINRCRAELSGLPPLAALREEVVAAAVLARAEADLAAVIAEEARLRALAGRSGDDDDSDEGDGGDDEDTAAAAAAAPATSASSSAPPPPPPPATIPITAAPDVPGADPELLRSLDWEAILDVPHGSLRLPGCYKSPWMDRDPEWVLDKAYSPVEWRREDDSGGGGDGDSGESVGADGAADAGGDGPDSGSSSSSSVTCSLEMLDAAAKGGGAWHKLPLTMARLCAASIHPTPAQQAAYEASPAFLEDAFEDVERRRAANARRKALKQRRKAVKALKLELGLGGGGGDGDSGTGAGAESEQPSSTAADQSMAAAAAVAPKKTAAVAAGGGDPSAGSSSTASTTNSSSNNGSSGAGQARKRAPLTLAEAAAAALEQKRRAEEEKRRREAEAAAARARAEAALRAASGRLAGGAGPSTEGGGGGPRLPPLRRPSTDSVDRPRRPSSSS